jgi:hypothetical protein
MPWLDVFLFHQWAVKEDWGWHSGKYKRDSRFARLDRSSVSRPFSLAHFHWGKYTFTTNYQL